MYEEQEEQLGLGESPGKEIADERGFTDRTSKLTYEIDKLLMKPAIQRDIVELLQLDESSIRVGLGQPVCLGRGRSSGVSIGLGGYGRVALPGVELTQWPYADELIDLKGYPRLLIHTAFEERDFPPLGETVITETTDADGQVVSSETVWHYRPLMIRVVLLHGCEMYCDWRDVEALQEVSFRYRLQCIRHSVNMLFGKIVPRILQVNGYASSVTESSMRL